MRIWFENIDVKMETLELKIARLRIGFENIDLKIETLELKIAKS